MLLQWVYSYTCWRRPKASGNSRAKGFGTYSWTEGLSLTEIEELEARCSAYAYPSGGNLPSRPTQEDIDRLFPVAFYSFKLASGRRAIVKTRYVGKGFYDNRWGATISHGLILDKGNWPVYPLEYFDSPVFWKELPEDVREKAMEYKDRSDAPPPPFLSALDLADLPVIGEYTETAIADRMTQGGDSASKVAVLLGRYFQSVESPAPITVMAPFQEVPFLFAAFTMALPKDLSQELTFCTYSDNQPFMSQGTGGRFKIVAVNGGQASLDLSMRQPPNADMDSLVSAAFSSRKPFFAFLDRFTGIGFSEIPLLCRMFRFVEQGAPIDNGDFEGFIDLLDMHGDEGIGKMFLSRLFSKAAVRGSISNDWLEKIEERIPAAYIAVLRKCPDNPVKAAAINRVCQSVDSLAGFASKAIQGGCADLASEAVSAFFSRRENSNAAMFIQTFDALRKIDKDFADAQFFPLFKAVKDGWGFFSAAELKWLLDRKSSVPKDGIAEYGESLDSAIPWPEGNYKEWAGVLSDFLSDRVFSRFREGRAGLFHWGIGLLEGGKSLPLDETLRYADCLGGAYATLSAQEQNHFAWKVLPELVAKTSRETVEKSHSDQSAVIGFFGSADDPNVKRYIASLYVAIVGGRTRKGKMNRKDIRLKAFLLYCLQDSGEHGMRPFFMDSLAGKVFDGANKKQFAAVADMLAPLTPQQIGRLNSLEQLVSSRKRSFLQRVLVFLAKFQRLFTHRD